MEHNDLNDERRNELLIQFIKLFTELDSDAQIVYYEWLKTFSETKQALHINNT